jgi:hypothetical protein
MSRERVRGHRLLAACFLGLLLLLGAAYESPASLPPKDMGSQTYSLPICPPKSPMEMQMTNPKEREAFVTFSFGERLQQISPAPNPAASASPENLDKNSHQMTAKFRFAPSAEFRVSFLYNQDPKSGQSAVGLTSHLLFRYSMDYCIMPTLKVGMSGYLYKPATEYFTWRNSVNYADPVFGFGPGLQYDLGRWSFLLRSQLEPGIKDRGESLHNWFRVWYAF